MRKARRIFWSIFSKYKGTTKEIRRAKRAGQNQGVSLNTKEIQRNCFVFLEIQRKYKGNPARGARRNFFTVLDPLRLHKDQRGGGPAPGPISVLMKPTQEATEGGHKRRGGGVLARGEGLVL